VILSVGRLVRRKGFDHVIENLPVLWLRIFYYLICGQGPMEPELKSSVSRLGVEKCVLLGMFLTIISQLLRSV